MSRRALATKAIVEGGATAVLRNQTAWFMQEIVRHGSKGLDPRNISRNNLLALGHPTSPIKAIRAHCVDCSGGSSSEARKCTVIDCPLWPMRMGVNVFHASARGA